MRAAGVETYYRDEGSGPLTVLVHGNPDTSDQWRPLLDRAPELGRLIAPDLPGFGRSGRPDPADFGYALADYDRWFEAFLDELGAERLSLVVHDWGALSLPAAARRPDRVERLVVVDAVPLSGEYRWHWLARLWRTPGVGEALMAGFNRLTLKQLSRLSSPRPGPQGDAWLDEATRHLDGKTKRAILRLYRSADPEVLERAGAGLGELRCPALVVWGEGDPYVGLDEARRYADKLPNAELAVFPDVGHWCLREEPAALERVVGFLRGDSA